MKFTVDYETGTTIVEARNKAQAIDFVKRRLRARNTEHGKVSASRATATEVTIYTFMGMMVEEAT